MTSSAAATTAPSRNTAARVRGLLRHEAVLAVLLVVLLLVAGRMSPDFVAPGTQAELLSHVWETALLALPMTLLILTGGIDLSVGSTMALSAVVFGLAFRAGLGPVVGSLLALGTGALAGALNGLFVARVRVHPLIVTLATLAAFRGIAEGISLARPVSNFPASFTGPLGGGALPAALFVVAALLAAFVLARTPLGLFLRAIGHNETACRFSGVPVDRIKFGLYTLSGFAAGVAALLFVARRNTAKADIGQGIELDVVTMVVLGGTSIFGGRGTILGTMLGVLLVHETREWVRWQFNRDELNLIVLGALLIASVLLHRLFSSKDRSA